MVVVDLIVPAGCRVVRLLLIGFVEGLVHVDAKNE
jgi:hypothetical protein